MEVKINKEIRNYTESMFFGLSLRQFIFSVLACGMEVVLYFLLIIPGISEPPVRTLRATIPENERHIFR